MMPQCLSQQVDGNCVNDLKSLRALELVLAYKFWIGVIRIIRDVILENNRKTQELHQSIGAL